MTTITSKHNERLKELRKLHERKHRERTGLFTAEGEDLLAEAARFGRHPDAVFYDNERIGEGDPPLAMLPPTVERVPVAGDVLDSASALGSGSRVIGLFGERWSGAEDLDSVDTALYLHDVADPGNVGAVLRSALALADAAVLLSPSSADPFGPKAVRASMGAVFGQPVLRVSHEELGSLLDSGWRTVALVPRAGRPLGLLEQGPRTLFCLGAERLGMPGELAARCDELAHVPLREGGAESLNVAMTATLCLYHQSLHRLPGS
jgi:TrmH family RNA methyltransferase